MEYITTILLFFCVACLAIVIIQKWDNYQLIKENKSLYSLMNEIRKDNEKDISTYKRNVEFWKSLAENRNNGKEK